MNIQVTNLSKEYYLEAKVIPVLKNINLAIDSGDLVSLTGASGAGKSTFLHLLGTLDTPTHGSISYNNIIIQNSSDTQIAEFRNNNIGYVFQFHHLMSEFSALENVMMPLLMRRLSQLDASKKAREILAFVGLAHRTEHKPGELSGGEQQRVALARALVPDPKLLLADEPTGNLDEKTGEHIVNLILDYNKGSGATVVLVTHNPKISAVFGRKLVLTHDGLAKIIKDGN
jgi:lipoprotein-releasing system ATP-binding protein